jgi:Phosphotransferase enzyme family
VERLAPWPLHSGHIGLGEFVLERILPGTPPVTGVGDALRDGCLDFLVQLFELGRGVHVEDAFMPLTAAESIAPFVRPAEADVIRELGRRLDAELVRLERGFAHGDFWLLNLLVDEQGRLSGVVDWEAAGAGRLPLLDLFHFHVHARLGPDAEPGPGLIKELVPWLRSGGDRFLDAYCRRVGVVAEPALLEGLALAYWLDWTAYSLETYGVEGRRPGWLADNVEAVVAWLGGQERG